MHTVEIVSKDWGRTLDAFTAIHEGWLVSLDVLSSGLGAQPEVIDVPLLGLTVEPGGGSIRIAVARSADEHFTHAIHAPIRLWIERTDGGADSALQVESADGTKTILRLKIAALPETVDGLAPPHRHLPEFRHLVI